MNYKIIPFVIFSSLIFAVSFSSAQGSGLALSVKPGMLINAAHFGYKTGSLFAGLGLEFASISVESKSTYTYEEITYSYSSKVGATIFLPQIGTRIFLSETDREGNKVSPYLWLNLFYTLSTTKITYDGEPDTSSARSLNDLLSGNFGGSAAFGGEYFFSSNFSIGGEFGVRFLFGGTKTTTSYYYESTYENKLGLGVTYTAMGLNFYF